MALEKKTTILGNVKVNNAYIIIDKVLYSKDRIVIHPLSYVDKASKDRGDQPIPSGLLDIGSIIVKNGTDEYSRYFSDTALKQEDTNLFLNAYTYIKTLPIYDGAKDV